MTRRLVLIALLTATSGLASCDRNGGATTAGDRPDSVAAAGADAPDASSEPAHTPAASPAAPLAAGEAIEGAPAFAVIYPGGVLETTPLTPVAADGSGGSVLFTSAASPDEIVEFYRRKAEAAGLAQITSLNQGETRGYGASGPHGGPGLQVVAFPIEPGRTSVQVTWKAEQ